MTGLRRQVGAARVLGEALAPTHWSRIEKPTLSDAASAWHILSEDGKSRTPVTFSGPAAVGTNRHPSLADLGLPPPLPAPDGDSRKPVSSPRQGCPLHRRAAAAGTVVSIGPTIRRSGIDARLIRLVDAWATLPLRIRDAILAMIDAAGEARSPGNPPKKG